MDSPGICWPNGWISIPELRLEHLSAGVVEAAGILAMVLSLAAHFGGRTLPEGCFGRTII